MPPATPPAANTSQPSRNAAQQAHAQRRALDAVQEALDRRDNGGDAASTTDN